MTGKEEMRETDRDTDVEQLPQEQRVRDRERKRDAV